MQVSFLRKSEATLKGYSTQITVRGQSRTTSARHAVQESEGFDVRPDWVELCSNNLLFSPEPYLSIVGCHETIAPFTQSRIGSW